MNAAVSPITPPPEADQEHTWDESTLAAVAAYGETVADVRKKRETLNARIQKGKAELVELGFNKEAVQAAISYANTDEAKRLNWDESYIFTRRALGVPIQEDLFMAAMQESVTVTTPKKEG